MYKKLKSLVRKTKELNLSYLIWSIFRGILVTGICYIILFPLLVQISNSFMREVDLFDNTVQWIPRAISLENYVVVWEAMDYPRSFLNSLQLSSIITILQLFSATLVGYGLARYDFPFKNVVFAFVIFTLIVPAQTIMISLYLNFRFFNLFGLIPGEGFNLMNSYWPLVLMAFTGAGLRGGLFIFIMRQFFKGMPSQLEEAAYIDGAGPLQTFFRIMLPGAVPGLVVVVLFAFVWMWNDYQLVSTFFKNANNLTLALANIQGGIEDVFENYHRYTNPWAFTIYANAAMILFIAPLVVLYGFLQRYFIESVQRTGIVG